MPKLVTANTLATGQVVFLSATGTWVAKIDAAAVYPDAGSADVGLEIGRRDAERSLIVDPFVVEMGAGTDGKPAMTLRDTIRAHGPTIRYLPIDPAAARG